MNQELSRGGFAQGIEPLAFRSMESFRSRPALRNLPRHAAAATEEPVASTVDHAAELRAALERGRQEGLAAGERDLEAKLQAERESVQRTLKEFQEEKQRYFTAVEGEVVKLSLAIAERILQREAEMDPTLLAGVARVALSQIADSDQAVLHVATEDVKRWTDALKPAPKGLTFEGDEDMKSGDVLLKTSSGTIDLGLRKQLQEVERGFLEVLGRKPAMMV